VADCCLNSVWQSEITNFWLYPSNIRNKNCGAFDPVGPRYLPLPAAPSRWSYRLPGRILDLWGFRLILRDEFFCPSTQNLYSHKLRGSGSTNIPLLLLFICTWTTYLHADYEQSPYIRSIFFRTTTTPGTTVRPYALLARSPTGPTTLLRPMTVLWPYC